MQHISTGSVCVFFKFLYLRVVENFLNPIKIWIQKMSGHPDNAMICLCFFNVYFHKIVLTVEGSFILNIRKTFFSHSLFYVDTNFLFTNLQIVL